MLPIIRDIYEKRKKLYDYKKKRISKISSNIKDEKTYNIIENSNNYYNIESVIVTQKIRYDDKVLPTDLYKKVFYSEKIGMRVYVIYNTGEKAECLDKLADFFYNNNFIFKANKNAIIEYIKSKYFGVEIDESFFSVSNVDIVPDLNKKAYYCRNNINYFNLKKDYINTNYFNITDKLVYGYIHNLDYDYYTNIFEDKCKIDNIGDRL